MKPTLAPEIKTASHDSWVSAAHGVRRKDGPQAQDEKAEAETASGPSHETRPFGKEGTVAPSGSGSTCPIPITGIRGDCGSSPIRSFPFERAL